MPDPKLYIEVLNDGSQDLYIRDAEAQEEIANIKETIKNGTSYIGKFISAVIGGETVTELKQGDAPTSVTTTKGTFVPGTPADGQYKMNAGDYLNEERTGKSTIELYWNGAAFDEYGSTSALKNLAFQDSASGNFTPSGTNAPSAVSFDGQADADFVSGFNDDAVSPSFSEGAFTPASLGEGFVTPGAAPSFSEGAFTPAQIQAGFVTPGVAPSFNEGAYTPAEIQSGFVTPGSAATFSEGAFDPGQLPSMTYDSANRKLTFGAGALPSKAADTFDGGTPTAIDTTKFSGGSKAADTFSAGSPTAIDVTKFDGGSKAADTFSAGSVTAIDVTKFNGGSKAADQFSAGSAATPIKSKAITAVGTATAAAQTFTGTQGTVTVE